MIHLPRPLQSTEREALVHHLLGLAAHDRYLRFGAAMSDQALRVYANRIDLDRDAVLGVFGAGDRLLGAAHVARGRDCAELGLSVLSGYRRRGIGSALVAASCAQCGAWGVGELVMRCAAENTAMRNLALAHGMRVLAHGSDVDAVLPVPTPFAALRPAVFLPR